MEHARRNVLLLAWAQATLPSFSYIVGAALATIPASLWMRRVGRRNGLLSGGAIGLVGSVIATAGIAFASFALLCLGSALLGVYNAFGAYYRFAAADVAPPDFKAKAISYVLAGGLVGGLVGPELSKVTVDLAQPRFVAAYASLFVYCLVAMAIVSRLAFPQARGDEGHKADARPLLEIARQPVFVVAAACASLGYGVMTLLMTATPLAMGFCGHPFGSAATVIAAHVVAMFAPSFFTGSLIQRFGVLPVILTGVAIEAACVAVALSGDAVANFWWALVLLGLGWNFTYVGGTTLLTEAYRPSEKAKAQGLNEFIVFGVQALASISSGVLVNAAGWSLLNAFALPLLAAAATAAVWLMARRRAASPS